MTHVLIAEKQTLVRKMLKTLLDADSTFEVAAEAENCGEVIEKLQHFKIDLLLLDLSTPGISGIDLIIRAKALHPELAILIFSLHSDNGLVTQALKNGAGGYISSMHDSKEFLNAVRKVAAGGRYIDPGIAESLLLENVSGDDEALNTRLSRREMEIFRLLVAGKGVNEIAEQLIISNKTVSSHKKKLFEKMHFSGMADLMRYAVQRSLFDEQSNTFEQSMELLRSNAEAQLANAHTLSSGLEHELQLHQIELEMQNEQLRNAQSTLEHAHERYVSLYENAPVACLILSPEGLITEINLTAITILGGVGGSRKKLLNRRFAPRVVPEDRERWDRHFLHTQQHTERQTCDLTIQRADGSLLRAHLDSQCQNIDDSLEIHVVLTDLSEQPQTTAADEIYSRHNTPPKNKVLS